MQPRCPAQAAVLSTLQANAGRPVAAAPMAAANATAMPEEVGGGHSPRPAATALATAPSPAVQGLPCLLIAWWVAAAGRLASPCLRRSSHPRGSNPRPCAQPCARTRPPACCQPAGRSCTASHCSAPPLSAGRGPHRPAAAGRPAQCGRQRRPQCRLRAAVRQRCHWRVCHLGAAALPHGQVRRSKGSILAGTRVCQRLPHPCFPCCGLQQHQAAGVACCMPLDSEEGCLPTRVPLPALPQEAQGRQAGAGPGPRHPLPGWPCGDGACSPPAPALPPGCCSTCMRVAWAWRWADMQCSAAGLPGDERSVLGGASPTPHRVAPCRR